MANRHNAHLDDASAASGLGRRRACSQCTRSKKKCDKHVPVCGRCATKGITCDVSTQIGGYLGNYYRSRDMLGGGDVAEVEFGLHDDHAAPPGKLAHNTWSETSGTIRHDARQTHAVPSMAAEELQAPAGITSLFATATPGARIVPWYLHPITLQPLPEPSQPKILGAVHEASFRACLEKMQVWMVSWVRDGSCPLVHPFLWGSDPPLPIQEAYTAAAAYLGRTPGNRALVMRILEKRTNTLVNEQTSFMANSPDQVVQEDERVRTAEQVHLDTRSHLARTQALVFYQLMRLFEGDMRARTDAERHLPVLERWLVETVDSARLDAQANLFSSTSARPASTLNAEPFGESFLNLLNLSSELGINSSTYSAPIPGYMTHEAGVVEAMLSSPYAPPSLTLSPTEPLSPSILWRTWILSESLRRVFIAGRVLITIYRSLSTGIGACAANFPFTGHAGLWSAQSPYKWLEAGEKAFGVAGAGAALPITGDDFTSLLDKAAPDEVDEFTRVIIMAGRGLERMERWEAEKSGMPGNGLGRTEDTGISYGLIV